MTERALLPWDERASRARNKFEAEGTYSAEGDGVTDSPMLSVSPV